MNNETIFKLSKFYIIFTRYRCTSIYKYLAVKVRITPDVIWCGTLSGGAFVTHSLFHFDIDPQYYLVNGR